MSRQKSVYKILLAVMIAMMVAVHFTAFVSAAPPILPPCGHDTLVGSTNSGRPDIDVSSDGYYTAVVWTEDLVGGVGNLKLAYSNILTSTIAWLSQPASGNVETGSFQDPTIDFDPVVTNTVHIAYKDNNGIRYIKCPLGGTCSTPFKIAGTNDKSNHPQIAATPDGVVIVFDDEDDNGIKYVHIKGGTSGNTSNIFQPYGSVKGRNPSVVFNNNKVHVVFTNLDLTPNDIQYFNLNTSDLGTKGTSDALTFAPGTSNPSIIGGQSGGNSGNADYPAIAAVGDTAMAVWDYHYTGADPGSNDYYVLAGSVLSDTSTTNWTSAKVIPTDSPYTAVPGIIGSNNDLLWESRTVNSGDPNRERLRPDVFLVEKATDVFAHVVWQAEIDGTIFADGYGTRTEGHDIMYAYTNLNSVDWKGVPMGNATGGIAGPNPNGRTDGSTYGSTHALTDLTVEYFANDGRDNAHPRAVFLGNSNIYNQTYNRLQLVYRSFDGTSKWDVRYNGFEMGKDNLIASPDQSIQNSDCDVYYPDSLEIDSGGDACSSISGNFNEYVEYNCDAGLSTGDDSVPDYLDSNSDGDFQSDIAEGRKDEVNGTSDSWRTPDADGGVFLPVVLKS